MNKRFIDTGFLDQKWIRKLSPEKKIFLIYLMLKCDNGGIIELDLEDASFWIGKEIKSLEFLPEGYLIPLNDSGKFFMPKFIEWQYKDLSSNKFIVAQARQILEKHNLINDDFTLNLCNIYVNITKDVPESQEQGIGIGIGKGKGLNIEFDVFWNLYDKKVGDKTACQKKWANLKDIDRQKIIDTLPEFLSNIKDKQYQPFPATYLNQRRWENDIVKNSSSKSIMDMSAKELAELSLKSNKYE